MFFEIVRQRIADAPRDLLVVFDEPFAGVTDDFVPFIRQRLVEIGRRHNVLLVTNDHVHVLTDMAENVITVSAVDRSVVRVNDRPAVDREKAMAALSVGDPYVYQPGMADARFFWNVEVASNTALLGVVLFTFLLFSLFLLTFWGSSPENAALILIAGDIMAFFGLNPYLLSGVEWRNCIVEEAEALIHASVGMNRLLRTLLCVLFVFLVACLEFGIVNACVDSLESFTFFLGMFFDTVSTTLPFLCLALYTSMSQQSVEMISILPFLSMLFLSTTFSPGAGVTGLKELRYLFPRFYFWCAVPSVQDEMEGCPVQESTNVALLAITSLNFLFIFLIVQVVSRAKKSRESKEKAKTVLKLLDEEFEALQIELFGERGRGYFRRPAKIDE